MTLDRAIAGLVTVDKKQVVVISMHAKCCGYAGSREDTLRVQQAEQVVGEIRRMRNGDLGDRFKDLPIVLIGDYNLVGSRKPLDILAEAGLKDVICRDSNGSAYTWRGLKPNESFWPGRLDLATHSAGLKPLQAFVLNSSRLPQETLGKLKLNPQDSRASDHLLLLVDFHERIKSLEESFDALEDTQIFCR